VRLLYWQTIQSWTGGICTYQERKETLPGIHSESIHRDLLHAFSSQNMRHPRERPRARASDAAKESKHRDHLSDQHLGMIAASGQSTCILSALILTFAHAHHAVLMLARSLDPCPVRHHTHLSISCSSMPAIASLDASSTLSARSIARLSLFPNTRSLRA
jgi:hypothetical protein